MTDLDLDAIEARANAAIDGPWVVKHEPAWEADNVQHPDVITVGAQMWEADDEPMTVCLVSTDHEDDPVDVLLDAEFIAHARTDVPALVAEVRRLRERAEAHAVTVQQAVAVERQRDEARAEVERWEADFPCDEGCRDYPEETCSRHGRRPADLWERGEFFARERDDWRRRYEALRDGVTSLCDDPHAYYSDGRRWVAIHVLRVVVDPQHPGDES